MSDPVDTNNQKLFDAPPQHDTDGSFDLSRPPLNVHAGAAHLSGPVSAGSVQQWVEEHGDFLFRYCLRHCRNEQSAEDLVQETFLAAVRCSTDFQGRSSVRTWLTSILRNKIVDRIRQTSRQRNISYDELENENLGYYFAEDEHWAGSTGPREWNLNPESAFENRQFIEFLDVCLKKLPEKLRSIFVLREIEELSREEIATQLETTANNIGVILHRARLQLRECLQLNWLGGESR